jgi:hypothetical protein
MMFLLCTAGCGTRDGSGQNDKAIELKEQALTIGSLDRDEKLGI